MRLFLDANVLFTAAHNPDGKASLLIELGSKGCWSLVSSHYASEEARRNLLRKFPDCLHRLDELQTSIRLVGHQPAQAYPKGLVAKDQPIFQAAMASKATHLLTGDLKDFGAFMNKPDETFGILVQTVAEFLGSLDN